MVATTVVSSSPTRDTGTFSRELRSWLLPCLSWPAITTRICGSVIRSLALAIRSARSPRSCVSAILLVWSISSTMTLTLRGSFVCVMGSLVICRRCSNGRRANWRGPQIGPRQLRYLVVSRSEDADVVADVHVRLDGRVVAVVRRVVIVAVVRAVIGVVGVHRVVVMARVDAAGDVATVGVDGRDVAATGVRGGGLRRGDDHPAAGPTGRRAAGAAAAEDAAMATIAAGRTATAGVD